MFKKIFASFVLAMLTFAAQSGPVVYIPGTLELKEFKLDLTGIDKAVGGLSHIEWSSDGNPGAWDKKIQVQINPFADAWFWGEVGLHSDHWIVDVPGNGYSFPDIHFYGVQSSNYDIIHSGLGIGILWEYEPNKIHFMKEFSTKWVLTPDPVVSSIPEPGSLALLGLGLFGLGFTTMKKKKVQIATSA